MGQHHILIVDDEAGMVQSLVERLRDEGFMVSLAREGRQALALSQYGIPDVVLLDIWLPGMDGIETLQAFKHLHTEVPVIIMSGHGNIETAVAATKLGAFAYIEKPFACDYMLSTIYRALGYQNGSLKPVSLSAVELIGSSSQMARLRRQLEAMQGHADAVLIRGVDGSEQETVARLLHLGSPYREGALVTCDCPALPQHAAERLLFGTSAGTDSLLHAPTRGYLERANGGSLFLHGIEYLPRDLQQRLLHVVDTGVLRRVGGTVSVPLNVRYIGSYTALPDQLFPELAARFACHVLELPPLRERKSDLPDLVRHQLRALATTQGGLPKSVDDEALAVLHDYDWPGDVRELRQLVQWMTTHLSAHCLGKQEVSLAFENLSTHQSSPSEVWKHVSHRGSMEAVRSNGRYHVVPGRRRDAVQSDLCTTSTIPSRHDSALQSSRTFKQKTLRQSTVLYGQGLQSGLKTGVILSPLPPNSGIVFWNIATAEQLPASVAFVASTDFSTSLRKGGVMARTIEHLMSALHAYRISNVLVKISDEIPIMDGSASAFCDLVEQAGIIEQDVLAEEFVVERCYHVGDVGTAAKSIVVEPYDGFRITYRLDYPAPLGVQEYTYEHQDEASYRRDIAPARTFAFVKDVEQMHEVGLVAGGRLNNVILLDGEKIVNSVELHFPDECARHKVLDIMGDLYLLGRPLRGHVRANMTGHTENIALVQKLSRVIAQCA